MSTNKIQDGTETSIPKGNYEVETQKESPSEIPLSTSSTSGDSLAPSDFVVIRQDNTTAQFYIDIVAEEIKRQQIELNRKLRRASRDKDY